MKKVLILKRTSFGDIIHTMPVLTVLRNTFPEINITWVTEFSYEPFVRAFRGVDESLGIGFRSMFMAGKLKLYRQRLKQITTEEYDALVDFQGTLKSWMILRSSNALQKIGFNKVDAREPMVTHFYTTEIEPMPYGMHIIRQNLRLLKPLGIDTDRVLFPQLMISDEDEQYIRSWLQSIDHEKIVIVNPFTNWMTKSWPVENIKVYIRKLYNESGHKVIVLWGPGEEETAAEIVEASDGAAFLAPQTNLMQLAALLKHCRLYVGGDTGPTQLAVALGAPVVALFGPTDPRRNGPIDERDKVLRIDMECRGCKRNECRFNTKVAECMLHITPDMVLEVTLERLQS